MIAEKTSTTLSINHKILSNRIIEMDRNIHRLEQYSHRECSEIAEIPSSITNDILEEHVILILEELGEVMEAMNTVAYHK